ncbi:MAG: methionyl-tRNA formyltransferase [Chloroflexi bacterium]|nr:methionyl-tRNA formyltransferase [Chloroflexota bacterium]
MTRRVVFMGTPDFAVPALQALIEAPDFNVVGVVTQPDRPAGRGKQLQQSPIKQLALQHNIEVFQPEKLRGAEVMAKLRSWYPHLQVVAAYGQILKQAVLDVPEFGSINVHASLLPRWRGAAPIQASILAGDAVTGITIMQMDAGLDTGPMLSQEQVEILPYDTGETLHNKLATVGGPLLVNTLRGFLNHDILPQQQDDARSTYAPRINKEDGKINWADSAIVIDRRVRAFNPWPSTFTTFNGQILKLHLGLPLAGNPKHLKAGQVSIHDSDAPLVIGTGDGRYAPSRLQLEGRKAMGVMDFLNGVADIDGAMLE